MPNVIHQVTQVVALFYIGPGVYAIFMRSSVIITAILALILFPEERWIIRQWQFQAGTILGLLGAIGVLWFQPGWETGHVQLRGFVITVIAAFCWALYGVLVKRPSAESGPIRSFGLISFITSVLLFALTLPFGDITTPLHVGTHVNVILVISAVTCISLAHVLYYIAIRELGVALSQTLQLLCPLAALRPIRLDIRRTSHRAPTLERRASSLWSLPRHASETAAYRGSRGRALAALQAESL